MLNLIISPLAKLLKPRFYEILPSASNVLTLDSMYTNPKCTLLTIEILEGDLDVTLAKKKYGSLVPQTRCFITQWAGYTFWQKDENFDVDNHVSCYAPQQNGATPIDEQKLHEIKSKFFVKPYLRNRSPWEVLIVKNFQFDTENRNEESKVYTAVLIRFHHALVDGFSAIKQFEKPMLTDAAGEWKKPFIWPHSQGKYPEMWQTVWNWVKLIFCGPVELVIDQLKFNEEHEWSINRIEYTREYVISRPVSIKMEYLKQLKDSLNVSFTAIVLAAFAGAIRKAMVDRNVRLPKYIKIFSPLALPGHPDDKCTNHM